MSRRQVLRGMAVAPAAAPALAAGIGVAGPLQQHSSNQILAGGLRFGSAEIKPHEFTSFDEWWQKVGDDMTRRTTKQVTVFDPDIADMRLPLVTKVRMQRGRYYEKEKGERLKNFLMRQVPMPYFRESWFVLQHATT